MLESPSSGRIALLIREITFRLSQYMWLWSQSTNVTNGRTDRQTTFSYQ